MWKESSLVWRIRQEIWHDAPKAGLGAGLLKNHPEVKNRASQAAIALWRILAIPRKGYIKRI